MTKTELITSTQNPKIKELLLLQAKSSLRKEKGLFVVEGKRELRRCLQCGYKPRTVFFCPQICGDLALGTLDCLMVEVPQAIYQKISYREGTEGIIAEMYAEHLELKDLELGEHPLIAVLEKVEKPGNVGAVIRSVDACSADALIVCDPQCDIYNPNVIRASTGAVFFVPTVLCTSEEAIAFLQENNIQILTAQLQDSSLYYDCDMTLPTAIVIGSEDKGLSDKWRQAASSHIRIPMLGIADSLNASVSASILLFEALRQRRSKWSGHQ